jgi:hypothetical protein
MKSEFETYLTEVLCQKGYIKHVFLYTVLIQLLIVTSVIGALYVLLNMNWEYMGFISLL